MRLDHINLQGFKSFVESTRLSFPGRLTCVVGPNGCGKSNVIDAIRWVMGEGSAKTLRGASMADVIFNGSTHRPAAKQAWVELVFGEAELKQYPSLDEISVKRLINRAGQSHYFINGERCRRRDITELFLGTGMGARSYAIIEQGMISRFIEAKPDELRGFIEEAAGIALYKKRRRETELRLQHTQENMSRLEDVRFELDKQLSKLKRQVKAAEKYQQLKKTEYQLQGELLAMRWSIFDNEVKEKTTYIENYNQNLDEENALLAELVEKLPDLKRQRQELTATLSQVQEQYYQCQTEIKRLQQNIEHQQQRQMQLDLDISTTADDLLQTQETLAQDQAQYEQLSEDMAFTEEAVMRLAEENEVAQDNLNRTKQAWNQWQQQWDDHNRQITEPSQQIQVIKAKIGHLTLNAQQKQDRLQRLETEKQELDLGDLETKILHFNQQLERREQEVAAYQAELKSYQTEIQQQRESNHVLEAQQHQQQAHLQQYNGRLSSLQALQESALGKGDNELSDWLAQRGFDQKTPRLGQVLQVATGWERAVETVLGAYLEALCIHDLSQLSAQLDSLPQGQISALDKRLPVQTLVNSRCNAPLLTTKIQADWDISALLSGVYIADNLQQAYALRDSLNAHESVITAQGMWLGSNWLSITEDVDQKAGIFAREQDIQRLQHDIVDCEKQLKTIQQQLIVGRQQLLEHEQNRDVISENLHQTQREIAQIKAEHGGEQGRLEQMSRRAGQLLQEHRETCEDIENLNMDLEISNEQLLTTEAQLENLQNQGQDLEQQKHGLQSAWHQAQQQTHVLRDKEHQLNAQSQVQHSTRLQLEQSIERLETQLTQLQDKKYDLEQSAQQQVSVEDWEAQVETLSEQYETLEQQRDDSKQQLEQIEAELQQTETTYRELDDKIKQASQSLEQAKLDLQTSLVRKQTLDEAFNDSDYDCQTLLQKLPEEADETIWQQRIEGIEQKIQRLGAVNLAALEEQQQEAIRKQELDEQCDDVQQAIDLLEEAIAKIDDETRTRFLATLDKINTGFQRLFPTLFNGGQASLKLNSDDVLSAGVVVMAQPLGKRNTSIHLLSGGEKALTAVALVFAIFELNPAPFCLLDEVDAPLDDSNVSRYSALLEKMSEQVQFIFISHNKVAMEIAEQLVGITMQEAGVSRPVAVDIDLAVAMSEVDGV